MTQCGCVDRLRCESSNQSPHSTGSPMKRCSRPPEKASRSYHEECEKWMLWLDIKPFLRGRVEFRNIPHQIPEHHDDASIYVTGVLW